MNKKKERGQRTPSWMDFNGAGVGGYHDFIIYIIENCQRINEDIFFLKKLNFRAQTRRCSKRV